MVRLLKNASGYVLGRSKTSTYERRVRLDALTPCGLAGDLFEKPQERVSLIRSSVSS
jgi:hypothetical protein